MTSTAPLVAVAGGTSKQGRSVVRTLLADGRFRVRALTRDPSSPQARELARLGADVAAAPLEPGHDDEWFAAFTGARIVVSSPAQVQGCSLSGAGSTPWRRACRWR